LVPVLAAEAAPRPEAGEVDLEAAAEGIEAGEGDGDGEGER